MFSNRVNKLESLSLVFLTAALTYALYIVFLVVPNEKIMGPVQRIFYFHVGSAVACYFSFGLVFLLSLAYLANRNMKLDALSVAAAEVGFIFCSITLASGMIWGHSAWNTWFRWEPRLVTFLLLWIIFGAFNLLRIFSEPKKVALNSAVLGIIGGLNVPLVWLSVKFLPQAAQLHPQIVENRGLKDPSFIFAMFLCMFVLVALQFFLIWFRWRIEVLARNIQQNKFIENKNN